MTGFPESRRQFLAKAPLLLPGVRIAQADTGRDYHLTTLISPDQAAIVCPPGPGYQAVAERLSRDLQPRCGGRIEVRVAAPETTPWPASPRNLILLGNAIQNPLIFQLYVNHYTLADEYYPGRGGESVHSVHNPFGDGRNAIVLGANDPEGAARAAEILVRQVDQQGPSPGFLVHSRSTRLRYDVPPPEDFAFGLRARKEQIEKGDLPWPVTDYGILYHLTGIRQWGELFRDLHLYAFRLAHDRGEWPRTVFANPNYVGYFYLYRVLTCWDLIEESAIFSDSDRRDITALFLEVSRWIANLPYFHPSGELKQGNNHQTYAALSCHMAHRYYSKYYGDQQFAVHQPLIAKIFALHNRSWRPNDNEESTSVRSTRHLINYGRLNNDYSFFASGKLRQTADWSISVTDNRADTMAFGDSGEYDGSYRGGPRRVQSARHLALLSLAAWYYRDGRYAWARDWFRKGLDWKDRLDFDQLLCKRLGWQERYGIKEWEFYVGMLFRELAPVVPDHLLGLHAVQFDAAGVTMAKADAFPPAEVFDKLTFRPSFDRADEYMAVEGCTTLPHSHDDANCIMRLSWKDRLWIVEGDEMKQLRRYHNGLIIARNGEHVTPPRIALLKASTNGAAKESQWGLSQTVLPDDNGLDWERNIFWSRGRFFLVWDRLRAVREGDYAVECRWQTLGHVKLDHRTLLVEQDGETFSLASADPSSLSLANRGCLYEPDREAYRTYEHAPDGYMRVLRESQRASLRTGDGLEFVNLLQSTTGVAQVHQAKLEGKLVRVAGASDVVMGMASNGFRAGDLEVHAALFAADAEGIHLAGGTRVVWQGKTVWTSAQPAAATVAIPNLSAHIPAEASAHQPKRQGPASKRPAPSAKPPAWKAAVDGEVVALQVTSESVIAGTKSGSIESFDHAGRKRAAFRGTAPISSALALSGGQVLYGCRDASLALANPDGSIAWRKEFGPGIRQRLRVPAALIAIDDDVLAGMEDEAMFRFDRRGNKVWETVTQYHSVTNLGLVRFGGKRRITVGSEYYAMNLFDESGKQLWRKQLGPVTAQAVADLDGDGDEEILYSEWMGMHAVRPKDASVMWSVNLGGETLASIPVRTASGIRVVAASDAGQVACLTPQGSAHWRLDALELLTSLAIAGDLVILGCQSGNVQLRNLHDGALRSMFTLDSAVLKLAATPRPEGGVFGATERGTLFHWNG